jgi:hypothetical protein
MILIIGRKEARTTLPVFLVDLGQLAAYREKGFGHDDSQIGKTIAEPVR